MRGVRGQVALFFIIGLVLLFTVGIFYLIQGDAEEAIQISDDIINNYIRGCVDGIVESELKLLGDHGGIWEGVTPQYPMQDGVLYAVTAKRQGNALKPLPYPAPRYPDFTIGIRNSTLLVDDNEGVAMWEFQDGYFGDTNFPALCRECRHRMGIPDVNGVGAPEVSVEEALQERIQQRLPACINDGRFEQQLGVDVQSQPSTAKLTFTQQAVLLTVNYKLRINGEDREITFSPRYGVRYQALLLFAQDLAREETRNISFRPERDFNRIASFRPGFSISPPQPSGDATLYTITDASSRIANEPFRLKFLVQNRPPMLDQLGSLAACVPGAGADPDDQPVTVTWNPAIGRCTATSVDGSDYQEFGAAGSDDSDEETDEEEPLGDLAVELGDATGNGVPDHNSGVLLSICNTGDAAVTIPAGAPMLEMNGIRIYTYPYYSQTPYSPDPGTDPLSTAERVIPAHTCLDDLTNNQGITNLVYEKYNFGGSGNLVVKIDPLNRVPESDENNNMDQRTY